MYVDYVHMQQRVLEGVRTARVRAIGEMTLAANTYKETCLFENEPAAVLWVDANSGASIPYCVDHLRSRLEEYAEMDEYPPAIVPLARRGVIL